MQVFLLSLLFAVGSATVVKKDVCIFGAGASGMFSAVNLVDKGYDVVVLEAVNEPGGHCATDFYTPLPGFPAQDNFVDIGVKIYPDTRKVRQAGIYPFNINTTDFVTRFTTSSGYNPPFIYDNFTANSANYFVDLQPPPFYPPYIPENGNPNGAFVQALTNMLVLLETKYPWINMPGYPDPIPSELLVPFSQWVTDNGFTVLAPFLNQFTNSYGRYEDVTALYALGTLSPTVLFIFSQPQTAFHINGGCIQLYNGITSFLGSNILFNFTTTAVTRPPATSHGNGYVSITGINSYTLEDYKFHCDDVIVSFAPTANNLAVWDLDAREQAQWNPVQVRHFWCGEVTVTGNKTNGAFNMAITDFTSQFLEPTYPGLLLLDKQYPYMGPATFLGASEFPISNDVFTNILNAQFAELVGYGLIDSFEITDMDYHEFQPYVTNDLLTASPNFYTQVQGIQGYRNTWYVGAGVSFAGSYIVWEHAYRLLNAGGFPSKTQ